MNQFKCRHCDKPAHFYFRESEGGMLCVAHGALHATAQLRDMLERSRLDKSSCGGVEMQTRREVKGSDARKCPSAFADVMGDPDLHVTVGLRPSAEGPQAGVASGPQDSACASLEALPGTSSAALSGSSGTPGQGRPLTSFDDLPTFPERRKATAFLVADSSLIQASASSSDILPQPSSVQV